MGYDRKEIEKAVEVLIETHGNNIGSTTETFKLLVGKLDNE